MDKKTKALEYLGKDPILNVDIIQQIKRYDAEILYSGDDGVLVKAEWMYYLCATDASSARKAASLMGDDRPFNVHHGYEIGPVTERLSASGVINACYNAVYLPDFVSIDPAFAIKALDEGYLDLVKKEYTTFGGEEYILGRIKSGDLFGAFDENGQIMGFCGSHDDGQIGMLQVFWQHRRKGVASALMKYLINRDLERGYTPYSQIRTDNEISKQLHRKLGFVLSETPVFWN